MMAQTGVRDFRKIKIQQLSVVQDICSYCLQFCHLFLILSILVLFDIQKILQILNCSTVHSSPMYLFDSILKTCVC